MYGWYGYGYVITHGFLYFLFVLLYVLYGHHAYSLCLVLFGNLGVTNTMSLMIDLVALINCSVVASFEVRSRPIQLV